MSFRRADPSLSRFSPFALWAEGKRVLGLVSVKCEGVGSKKWMSTNELAGFERFPLKGTAARESEPRL